MLRKEVFNLIEHCAFEIDKILTAEELKNIESTLNEISRSLTRQLKWFAIEAPGIAKERNYNLRSYSGQDLPKGYIDRGVDAHGFELWKVEEGKEDKKIGWFSHSAHPKLVLKAMCEFEEEERN